ncbi:formylglycine-generating enzyme family protein [Pendulispora brunnea]|uniref:Formylglycine-generating enzyme family protein n=1 Tax=Pendulispora brunnea TaxID=2905690 RepID=A0ABZ2JXZ2_9BACT
MGRSVYLFCIAWLGLSGCAERQPEGHIIFHIDTDAPLPTAEDEVGTMSDPLRAPYLFDTLYIEFFSPNSDTACRTCKRFFGVDRDLFAQGVTMTVRGNVNRARVSLYRSESLSDDTALEMVVQLPPLPAEGAVHASIVLETKTVGSLVGAMDKPWPATLGAPSSSRVGTWTSPRRTECKEAPRPGEACIPGGAFFLGSNRLLDAEREYRPLSERLVTLQPFYLDDREVTQGAIADWLRDTNKDPDSVLVRWDGTFSGEPRSYCTYGRPEPTLPINCISKEAALEYCRSRGGTLPTDAEFEYAAGNLRWQPYIWGTDPPSCGDAVWGLLPGQRCETSLVTGPLAWSAERVGRDVLKLPTGEVYDLAGNLSEWVFDDGNVDGDACWPSQTRVYDNPRCIQPKVPQLSMLRGGNWADDAGLELQAPYRREVDVQAHSSPKGLFIGFRCARH